MKRAGAFAALVMALALGGCDLVAGFDRFGPAGEGGGGGGASNTGGASSSGGGPSTTGSGGGVTCADHLVISEIRTRGDAGATDDFVEIFNPTSAPVPLAGVKLLARAPSAADTEKTKWLGQGGELGPGEHVLVAGALFDDGATPDVTLAANASFGDDVRVVLRDPSDVLLDVICVCGTQCASGDWTTCTGDPIQNPNATPAGDTLMRDVSLTRDPECADTDSPSDFAEQSSSAASLTSP